MACRPKDESFDDSLDDAPTSKIFKSLGDSEAGRSFRNAANASGLASITRGSPKNGGKGSFTRGSRDPGGEEDLRSGRLNAAMQRREALDGRRGRGGNVKLPRAKTFERKGKTPEDEAAYEDGDEDEEENVPPNVSLAQRSSLVAQLELGQSGSQDSEAALRKESAKQTLTARFKSTNTGGHAADSDNSAEDDDVIATA